VQLELLSLGLPRVIVKILGSDNSSVFREAEVCAVVRHS
jgi:hypothetical protein